MTELEEDPMKRELRKRGRPRKVNSDSANKISRQDKKKRKRSSFRSPSQILYAPNAFAIWSFT